MSKVIPHSYRLLGNYDMNELANIINYYIIEGYQPYGNPFATQVNFNNGVITQFLQAVVKYE